MTRIFAIAVLTKKLDQTPPNGMAQRQRRDRETPLIIAPFLANRAGGAAEPLSAGARVRAAAHAK